MQENTPFTVLTEPFNQIKNIKKRATSLCILREEIGEHKNFGRGLFTLPICDIMELTQKPSSGRKVAREA